MSSLVSIIVPVFNAESTIDKCISSLLSQTYKNIEIILVDDGSQDKSGDLCDKFHSMDTRVVVIHKENNGVSSARNTALSIAKGEFIAFVDSDDYVDSEYVEHLYNAISTSNEVIMACCGVIKEGTENSKFPLEPFVSVVEKDEMIRFLLLGSKAKGWLGNKIYRRELINGHKLDEKLGFIEDLEFNLRVLSSFSNEGKIVFIDEYCYHYVVNNSSFSHISQKRIDGIEKFNTSINVLPDSKEKTYRIVHNYLNQLKILDIAKDIKIIKRDRQFIRKNCLKCYRHLSKQERILCLIVSISPNLFYILRKR